MSQPREWAAGLSFLKTELDTGLMFAGIANDSHDNEKRLRNFANAKKAHETALRLVQKLIISEEDLHEINSKLERLQFQLERLAAM